MNFFHSVNHALSWQVVPMFHVNAWGIPFAACLSGYPPDPQREVFIDDNEMICWTGPALWEFESPFPGSCTFLGTLKAPSQKG